MAPSGTLELDHILSITSLLTIPLEVREQILYYVFFPALSFKAEGPRVQILSPTEVYPNVFPDDKFKNYIGLAILRACRQLLNEGETVLFRHMRINLIGEDWEDSGERPIRFLESLCQRQLRLIRHLDLRAFPTMVPLCGWKNLMDFVATDCYSLRVLRLWCCPLNQNDEAKITAGCRRNSEWGEPILQVRTLWEFDMLWRKNFNNLDEIHAQTDDFIKWLRSGLLRSTSPAQLPVLRQPPANDTFRILSLPPRKIDERTENILPLFLTCRAIHEEAEELLYSKALFSSCSSRYEMQLVDFFYQRTPRQLKLIGKFFCSDIAHFFDPSFSRFLERNSHIEDLTYGLADFMITHPCFEPAGHITSDCDVDYNLTHSSTGTPSETNIEET
ncbi:hypothetical protein FQN54_004343 [Arachnomyces sp. PD_36]|nr:hypothetical protein FQN54_004343 [Arachnomyces sp. PD_36]